MIKTMAIFSAHAIHVLHEVVRDFFIALIVLLAALFFWLIYGIQVDKLDIGSYKIDGLYIKLDKKLILKAREITLPKKKANPSFDRVDTTFDRIKHLLTFFDTIMLEKVNFKNNHLTLLYADDVLYITSDIYEIAGKIERKGQKLVADVPMLYLKKEKVTISGKLSYDLLTEALETEGKFNAFGIRGHFRAVKKDQNIIYALNTRIFTDPKPLIRRFKMHPVIESWIIEKVQAKQYKIEYIKGKMAVKDQDIKIDLGALKGKIRFDDVEIFYKEKIPPAHAESMVLSYEKGDLDFVLKDPVYQGRDLSGTGVVIKHIIGPQSPVLILDLHALSPLDETVQKILRAYHLNIPVTHTGKNNKAVVLLKIPLGKKRERKIKAEVDVILDKGVLTIDRLPLSVRSGKIHYREGLLSLNDIKIEEKWYEGSVSGKVKVKEKAADLILNAEKITLGEGKRPFLQIKRKKIPLKLSYKEPLTLTLPTLETRVVKKNEELKIELTDIGRIVPFLQQNSLGWEGGELDIVTKDLKTYRFNGKLKKELCFFYEKGDLCYTSIPVEGTVNTGSGEIDLYAFNKRFHINVAKGKVELKNINIDLELLLKERKRFHEDKTATFLSRKKIVIIGENSQLRYGDYTLVTDSYDIEILPSGDIKAMGIIDKDVVKFSRKGKNFFMQALRVKDKMLHPLINFKGLKSGRYSIKVEGDPDKEMKGRIIIEGGILSDFKAYSNILAFINTVPALATLNSPGFSDRGFKIREGVIEYRMTPEKIIFDSIYLKGNTATVAGKGAIDLKTKKIDVKLAIMTVRELGKIVGKIPLLGYILMGENNSMTVGLEVAGTLENPKVSTSVAKDILTLPLQIIKRTITAPVQLGEGSKEEEVSGPQSETVPAKRQKHIRPVQSEEKKEEETAPATPSVTEPIRSEVPSEGLSEQLF
ncbi:AsmA-like C-terminal domain-containing protein [Sulfurovum sp. ST-21]|uniref:AsmA-like C-terminal domain-containing protein n=1 Tax=Sulfurovum indicum TaxID=2779528 RepID=A0A7M1S5I1_9BACT|nr:AsmA-like C-terminal domain-containing protein [Sulfurovum indicum]QOR62576.1 AsmA-like C-terminal domain-containing protein [Sulfurovum indicum]